MNCSLKGTQILVWTLLLIFVLVSYGTTGYAAGLFQKETPWVAPPAAELVLSVKCEPIRATLNEKTLQSNNKVALQELMSLYDENESSVYTAETPTRVTLDLGASKLLSRVRFLPVADDTVTTDRCLGMRFLVSDDNRKFRTVATVEPVDSKPMAEEWQTLDFGGIGSCRYVQVEIPAGAKLAELEWLELSEWSYEAAGAPGKATLKVRFYAREARRNMDADLVAAVYNSDGVMTHFEVIDQSFAYGEETTVDLEIPGVSYEVGESYRFMIWEKNGNRPLKQKLNYWYTGGTEGFAVSNVFSNDMILQAEEPLTIWGTAYPGTRVDVVLTNQQGGSVGKQVEVGQEAEWSVDLGQFSMGGAYTLTIRNGSEVKTYQNITFGDVWLCMGQSNMEYYMLCGEDTTKYLRSQEGIKESQDDQIRIMNLLDYGVDGAGAPVENVPLPKGRPAWSAMNREAAKYSTVIGYYFAQGIRKEHKIPVGIVSVAVGDTEINRWIPYGMQNESFTSDNGDLYHNRISPLSKLKIRGILLYQGEADAYRTHLSATEYRDALVGLVKNCREVWGEDIPFYWTQLTRYKEDQSVVREGQRLAYETLKNEKNIGIVSLLDLYGEYEEPVGSCREDIHPHQKQEVAARFLRYANRDVYGETKTPASGPIYRSMKQKGNQLVLEFDTTGSLTLLPRAAYADRVGTELIAKTGASTNEPQEFEIAGADGIFVKAKAKLEGNQVVVWNNKVTKPVMVRYAWGAYPEMPNLTDASGLPALTFTTEPLQ